MRRAAADANDPMTPQAASLQQCVARRASETGSADTAIGDRTVRPTFVIAYALSASCLAAPLLRAQAAAPPQTAPADARARADSLRHPYPRADVDFMQGMIGHHAQAVIMAQWAPTHLADPAVQRLAERILNAQQDEIATMQQWLGDRLQPVPEAKPMAHDMAHMDGTGHTAMMMPGMLTDAQMQELGAARSATFDRLFLTYMIQHHRGATSMVATLFATPGAGEDATVFKFASDVNVDQTTEIARMQRMLFEFEMKRAGAPEQR